MGALDHMASSFAFGAKLGAAFTAEAKLATFSEVQLFRALIRAFSQLRKSFHLEEYHGPKHQVLFNGKGAWGRTPARCELCDVLFVAYRTKPSVEVRLTFLQAKLSKEKHSTLCTSYPTKTDPLDFKANLEQWDLLHRRPDILPVHPFQAPSVLLQDAVLPSVGSFGVFHRASPGHIDFFYASADCLSVVGSPKTKNGRLTTDGKQSPKRNLNGHNETTFCCCLPLFGRSLYSLEIGTPVAITSATGVPSPLTRWLAAVMHTYVQQVSRDSPIVGELLGLLDVPGEFAPLPLPALVVIRADTVPDDEL
jgi:hypothetical protein